ncbi:MAG: NUDIX domain-containing protein [Actinobacteria bacterium]|nr:NUDIX domain-containing protein [Actinomycetota bacterium]
MTPLATDDLSGLRIREAVRGLVVDQNDHVLLAHLAFPARSVWVLPGGGLEADETHHQGLLRELREEVGLSPDEIGPHLWTRTHIIPFIDGRWDGQRERAYLVRTPRFEPAPLLSPEQLRAEYLVDLRWWSINELLAEPDTTFFAPLHLPRLIHEVMTLGPPPEPWEIVQRSTPHV